LNAATLATEPDATPHAMAGIHITDIESAINWWRAQFPSPDGITACPEVLALAEVYALMVYYREHEADEATLPGTARTAWLDWYASTPDAPCIAICSTSQGDDTCKGCGRSFHEVQHWPSMSPAEKRAGGVGLGLALVRQIVERHHGQIRCERPPEGGGCFVIRLPRSSMA
jgi:predicted Fe-S protein YdhL (DUF1289 family)